MNRFIEILSTRTLFYASLIFAAVLLVILAPKSAVNVDEQLHYPHAKKVVNWYFTGGADNSCLDTPVTNLKYYGQSVDNFTALINRVFSIENEFLTRHYTGAIFFWLLLVLTALVVRQISNNYALATLTVVFLLIMPRLFGQAFGNLKDIPFAVGYTAGVLMIIKFIKELPAPRWSTSVLLGLAIAFTCSVRIGGLILFGYLGLAIFSYIILKPFLLKHIVSTKLCLVRLLGQGLVIVFLGYFAGLLFWPFALRDVFQNPLESLRVMEHYKVSIRQVFQGELFWSTGLPGDYLIKWLIISTPEFILFGVLLFIFLFFKNIFKQNAEQLFFELFLLFTLIFPIVYVIVIDSNLYSGVRQMFFVLPLLAVFASLGLYRLLISDFKERIKVPVFIAFVFSMLLPIKHQAATFPADYIYFNEISGGNNSAWANYEYDYYFHGIKEPAEYLLEKLGDESAIVALNCNLNNYFDKYPNIKFQYVRYLERSSKDWDYGIFGINYIHPDQLKSGSWKTSQIDKIFYHRGNPIAIVVKRTSKDDLNGIRELATGNYDKGGGYLKQALKSDPNNVWLFVHLAKNCFNTGNFEEFDGFIEKGLMIHPNYEPLYLLKAQKQFEEEKYSESYKTLKHLMEINPRYANAQGLIEALKEKLNK